MLPEEEPVASSSAAADEPEPMELEIPNLFSDSNMDKKGAFQDQCLIWFAHVTTYQ